MIHFNLLLYIFLAVFLLRSGVQIYLNRLNIFHLCQHGARVPEIFEDAIDAEKLKRISAYTVDSENFNMVATVANQGLFLAVLLSGFLPWLVEIISLWKYGQILSGLIFFVFLWILTNLLRIPFSLYETFVIEERYGFNVMNFKLWISDLLKSFLLATILGGLLLGLLLTLVIHGGDHWWIWAWMLVGGFELFLLWLFPVVILPLFNKFDPIENKGLEERISSGEAAPTPNWLRDICSTKGTSTS